MQRPEDKVLKKPVFANQPPSSDLQKKRQLLTDALINLYREKSNVATPSTSDKQLQSEKDASLQAIRTYLLTVNDGQMALKEKHPFFNKEITRLHADYRQAAEAKDKWQALRTCLEKISLSLLAAVLPSFVLAAGIITAQSHTATIAAVIFCLLLGSISLFGGQAYIWFNKPRDRQSRYEIVANRFRQFYTQDFDQERLSKVYTDDSVTEILDAPSHHSVPS